MKLLILDGNSVINRAFFGVKPLTTREGLYTHAVFGFLNILERMERAHDLLPAEVFEEQYAERGDVEKEKRSIALELRKIIDDLREWLEMETRFRETISEW